MRNKWTPLIVFLFLAGVLSFYQNCTTQVPFGNEDYFQSLKNSSVYPYEVYVDQMAYMSCSEQENVFNDGTFFTFKLGAFDSGGLKITPEYRDSIEKVDNDLVPSALQTSSMSSGHELQFAVRTVDNLQSLYRDSQNGEEGMEGLDFDNFFPPMGRVDLTEILWYSRPNDYVRTYAAAQTVDEYRFEGSVEFMASEAMERGLRNFINDKGILAVTFAKAGENKPLGLGSLPDLADVSGLTGGTPPATDTGDVGAASVNPSSSGFRTASDTNIARNVFGVGVQPRFRQPDRVVFADNNDLTTVVEESPGTSMPARALASVSDVIIDDRMATRTFRPWVCPERFNFMIVLPGDAEYLDEDGNFKQRCRTNPDPSSQTDDLRIVRQSIYAEDFYVDLRNRCVVPKTGVISIGSCYGKNSREVTHAINYDTFHTEGCGFDKLGDGGGLCPHYVSVCFRCRPDSTEPECNL